MKGFFQTVTEKEQFIIFCIDDHHNIHTKHRPESKTQAVHITTLIAKVFPNIQAVPNDYIYPILPANTFEETSMKQYIVQHMSICSQK